MRVVAPLCSRVGIGRGSALIAGTTLILPPRRGLTPVYLLRRSTAALAKFKDTLNALAKLADTQPVPVAETQRRKNGTSALPALYFPLVAASME
jgi:hypothetical protein